MSYTYGIENESSKTAKELAAINIFSKEKAKKELEYAKENADYIFVLMHWGEAYATTPSKKQEEIADFLVENGANVILGNHPAAIQPMEVRQNSEGENVFIAYSLGNYISSIANDISKIEYKHHSFFNKYQTIMPLSSNLFWILIISFVCFSLGIFPVVSTSTITFKIVISL